MQVPSGGGGENLRRIWDKRTSSCTTKANFIKWLVRFNIEQESSNKEKYGMEGHRATEIVSTSYGGTVDACILLNN